MTPDTKDRLAGEGRRREDGPFPQASARPWRQEMVGAPASGGFHLYLVDAAGKKIAALWGKADEKADNGLLILDAVAAYDSDREQRILDAIHESVNALGGYVGDTDAEGRARADLIDHVLEIIEKAGGMDPLRRRAEGR